FVRAWSLSQDTTSNLRTPVNLICKSLVCGRKLEYPEETHQALGEHANSFHTDPETGIAPCPW
ncbi:Capsule polysaccharide modification protein LipA, partial [Clarias magur]